MHIEADKEFALFFRLLPWGMAVFLAYWLVARDPPENLQNSLVFGCYVAETSPSILLDEQGMHIRQKGFPRIGFHLEWHKTGIELTAEAPIQAEEAAGSYRFKIEGRGTGKYLQFYRFEGGRTYGVFDPALLERFQMLATDGAVLNYRPADRSQCDALTY